MKSIIKYLVAILAVQVMMFIAKADDLSFIQPKIPDGLWERHPEGISIALTLVTQAESDVKKSALKIYVKNTSNSEKEYFSHGQDNGVHIFYVGSDGSQVPLRDYNSDENDDLGNLLPPLIKTGSTLCITVDISPDELALLKSHPVVCRFIIYDPVTKQKYTIKSSPKLLTETSGQ